MIVSHRVKTLKKYSVDKENFFSVISSSSPHFIVRKGVNDESGKDSIETGRLFKDKFDIVNSYPFDVAAKGIDSAIEPKKKLQTLKKSKKIRNDVQSIINESSFHWDI